MADNGHAVLLTTHQLDVAEEVSDRVAIIHEGKIINEASTQELIRSHSGEGYVIDTVEPVAAELVNQLAVFGATAEGTRIAFWGGAQDFWKVMDLLRGNRLLRVERDKASLSNVFLDLVGEKAYA